MEIPLTGFHFRDFRHPDGLAVERRFTPAGDRPPAAQDHFAFGLPDDRCRLRSRIICAKHEWLIKPVCTFFYEHLDRLLQSGLLIHSHRLTRPRQRGEWAIASVGRRLGQRTRPAVVALSGDMIPLRLDGLDGASKKGHNGNEPTMNRSDHGRTLRSCTESSHRGCFFWKSMGMISTAQGALRATFSVTFPNKAFCRAPLP